MSDHDHHSGFEYEPALPISNGKLIVWLFLSTEFMFFAALIGVFIVILLEKSFEGRHEYGGVVPAMAALSKQANLDHVLTHRIQAELGVEGQHAKYFTS